MAEAATGGRLGEILGGGVLRLLRGILCWRDVSGILSRTVGGRRRVELRLGCKGDLGILVGAVGVFSGCPRRSGICCRFWGGWLCKIRVCSGIGGNARGLLKPGIAAVGALHITTFIGNDVIRYFVLGTTIRAGQTHKISLTPAVSGELSAVFLNDNRQFGALVKG